MVAVETYTTVAQVKVDLNIDAGDSRENAVEPAINGAHAAVDRHCRRTFARSASEARIFAPRTPLEWLRVGDMAIMPTVVEVKDRRGGSWATLTADEGYAVRPPEFDRPYRTLDRVDEYWPCDVITCVRVTAEWGWAAVPGDVTQATRLLTVRYVARFKNPTLSMANGMDELLRSDPDVRFLLKELRLSRAT